MKYRLFLLFILLFTAVTVMAQDNEDPDLSPDNTLTYTILNTISVYNDNYVRLTDDGRLLISAGYSDDGEYIAANDTTTGEEVFRTVLEDVYTYDIVFSPDQSQLIVVGDPNLGVIDLESGELTNVVVLDETDGFYGIEDSVYTENGFIAVADNGEDDLSVINIDMSSGSYTVLATVPAVEVYTISPDGTKVAFADYDFDTSLGTVSFLDIESGEITALGEYEQFEAFMVLSFNEDSSRLVAADDSALAVIFDLEAGEELMQFSLYDPDIGEFDLYGATFLTDNIVVGAAQYELQFLDLETGEVIGTVNTGDYDYVSHVAVSSDGSVLAAAMYDQVVILGLPDND
jgi:WD40 repeat protein